MVGSDVVLAQKPCDGPADGAVADHDRAMTRVVVNRAAIPWRFGGRVGRGSSLWNPSLEWPDRPVEQWIDRDRDNRRRDERVPYVIGD